jgi:hypothetical protein
MKRWLLLLGLPGCLAGTSGPVLVDTSASAPDAGSFADAGTLPDAGRLQEGSLRIEALVGHQYEDFFDASVLGSGPSPTTAVELRVEGQVLIPDAVSQGGPVANQFIWSLQKAGVVVQEGNTLEATVTDATGQSVSATARCDSWDPELICEER